MKEYNEIISFYLFGKIEKWKKINMKNMKKINLSYIIIILIKEINT